MDTNFKAIETQRFCIKKALSSQFAKWNKGDPEDSVKVTFEVTKRHGKDEGCVACMAVEVGTVTMPVAFEPEPPAMTKEELKFFRSYEKQMKTP
jgi:hypothetical protein